MKLFAQQGYGTGTKIIDGLSQGVVNGAILSPKDYRVERVKGLLSEMEAQFPVAERLLDPQLYASLIAHDPAARMGRLTEEQQYPYFGPRHRTGFESEANIIRDLRACLEFQASLAVTAVVAPNILIRRSLNSIEAVISKNFVRNAASVWAEVGDDRPLLATIVVDGDALQDRHELEAFLADLTIMENSPNGFYLLVSNPTSQVGPELVDFRTLAGWMLMNHSLSLNGFRVVNGFSDVLTPFLTAAGGEGGATGWWANLKIFSMDRFEPPTPGGRRPVLRYFSKPLLKSIRFDELERLRHFFPVMNGIGTDVLYPEANGSQPDDQRSETLQSWEAISSFANDGGGPTLETCLNAVTQAEQLYDQINSSPAMRLTGRSNGDHLEHLRGGIELFAQLAEIEL